MKNTSVSYTFPVLFLLLETESENEFRPLDERIDEFHPKATRTLFIGNLEKTTTYHDLRNIFQRFGGIVVGESSLLCRGSLPLLSVQWVNHGVDAR